MDAVSDATFDAEVVHASTPVVVDFWAPWCGPCRSVGGALAQLEPELESVRFVTLDIDENPVTASRYDVLSIPTVILFADGAPAETLVGARPAAAFRAAFAPYSA